MLDPFIVAVAIGLLGSVAAGPAVVYGLERVPPAWRRKAEWSLILGAVVVALLTRVIPLHGGGMLVLYVLAALPGLLAFLVFRTLLASTLVSLLPLYFVIGNLTRGHPTHVPDVALDRSWPLQPAWIFVYGSLYVFAMLLPGIVVRHGELLRRWMQSFLTVMLISFAGFLLYPTAAPRPAEVSGDGFAVWSLRLVYSLDPPHGCFPSLHVAWSFVSALTCYRVHRGVGIVATIWATLIALSTLYTKQHYIADLVAGVLIACLAYGLFLRKHPREAVAEQDRRRAPLRALAVVGIFGIMIVGFWVAYLIR